MYSVALTCVVAEPELRQPEAPNRVHGVDARLQRTVVRAKLDQRAAEQIGTHRELGGHAAVSLGEEFMHREYVEWVALIQM